MKIIKKKHFIEHKSWLVLMLYIMCFYMIVNDKTELGVDDLPSIGQTLFFPVFCKILGLCP